MSFSYLNVKEAPLINAVVANYEISIETPDGLANVKLEALKAFYVGDMLDRVESLEAGSGPSIWPNSRTLTVSGAATGSVTFNGADDFELALTIPDASLTFEKVDGLAQTLLNFNLDLTAIASSLDDYKLANPTEQIAKLNADVNSFTGRAHYTRKVGAAASYTEPTTLYTTSAPVGYPLATTVLGGWAAESSDGTVATHVGGIRLVAVTDHTAEATPTRLELLTTRADSTVAEVRWHVDETGALIPASDSNLGSEAVPVSCGFFGKVTVDSGDIISNNPIRVITPQNVLTDLLVKELSASKGLFVGNGNGIGINFGIENYFKIAPSKVEIDDHGGRMVGETASTENIYHESLGTGRGHYFKAGLAENPVFGIHEDKVRSAVPLEAPSFSGVASSTTKLETAVRINGVLFDGTNSIALERINTFETPIARWRVSHNLGKMPTVITLDDTGAEIYGVVSYPGPSIVEVNFSEEVTGKMYLS